MKKEKVNIKCKICDHSMLLHSLFDLSCNKVIEIVCKDDGKWECYYCTCLKFEEK